MVRDDGTQPGVRIDDALWERFREDIAQRKGSVRGHLRSELETAIREYLRGSDGGDTHDRLTRIEDRIATIDDTVDDIAGAVVDGEPGKTKKDSGVSTTTRKRLSAIESIIRREAGDAATVHESVINKAIENVAGTSEPTLRRYKEMLRTRRIVFENPHDGSDTWFTEPETFVRHVESNFPHRNADIAETYGVEWYDDVADDLRDDDTPAFQ